MKNGNSPWRAILRVLLFLSLARATADVEMGFVGSMTRPPRVEAVRMETYGEIEAARREWEPLQVVLRGSRGELSRLRLRVAKPVNGGGEELPVSRMFRGEYVRVIRSTELSPLPKGLYLDPLVPLTEGSPIVGSGGPGEGAEVAIINQPVWLDVRVPAGAKAGDYLGKVWLVDPSGDEVASRPFRVRVWDFVLPKRPTLKSSIGMDPRRIGFIYDYEPGSLPFNLLCRKYEDLLADHHLAPEGFWGSLEVYDADAGRASLQGGRTPGLGRPVDVYRHYFEEKGLRNGAVWFWPEWPLEDAFGKNRERALEMLAQLVQEFEEEGWGDRIAVHCGIIDEPSTRHEYAEVRRHGEFFDELESRYGVSLPMYVTEQPASESKDWGTLHGSVDIYVTHVSALWEDRHGSGTREVDARLAAGDEIWMYPAMVQVPEGWMRRRGFPESLREGNPPAWILDFPPMNHRIFAWAAPLYGVTGLLYWDTVEWRRGIDPWERADTLKLGRSVFNGDGLLLYPGHRDRVGFDGPVPSVRLKWIREGMEDHSYLTMLIQKEGRAETERWIRRICRQIGDWDADPARLFAVRREVARRLERSRGRSNPGPEGEEPASKRERE